MTLRLSAFVILSLLLTFPTLQGCTNQPQGDAQLTGPQVGPDFLSQIDGDQDGDGFAPPADCLDTGYAWATFEPECPEAEPLLYIPETGINTKDFAITEVGDTYHAFYIRSYVDEPWGPGSDSETTFGHITSKDLVSWDQEPIVDLRGSAGKWNDKNIWAPNLFKKGRKYWMFYTGVTYDDDRSLNVQRIGVATSKDLREWKQRRNECDDTRGRGCIMDCSAPWTAWDSGQPWSADCRDPFILKVDDGYLMYLTTRMADGRPTIAIAESEDLKGWELVAPVDVTTGSGPGQIVESPAVIEQDGIYHLFWTRGNGIYRSTATDPMGPWSPREFVAPGLANELMPIEGGQDVLFPYVFDYVEGQLLGIVFPRITFEGTTFTLANNASPLCQVPASAIYPGQLDPPNGIDDNCDGIVDGLAAAKDAGPRFEVLTARRWH